jgi:hypothetical protein
LDKVDKEIINEYLTQPLKCMSVTYDFVKGSKRYLKLEVAHKIYDGELELEEMKLDRLSKITHTYESWVNFVSDLA